MYTSLELIIFLLVCSVGFVALLRNAKLPPMIAYFLVGFILGPSGFSVLIDSESNRHLVEFGIVFLMFTIGLEFSLPTLNSMRKILFGVGLAQVGITLLLSTMIAMFIGLSFIDGFVVGAAITMSSTAVVSKILMERLDLNSRHGKLSIGILLFQDLAVIPVLILIATLSDSSLNIIQSFLIVIVKASILFTIVFWIGRPLMNAWFNLIARQKSSELFVLNVLLIILLFSYLTNLSGLSYALGAFIAGMIISETHYRYQVESDIAPFRDILLGLFFITVGMMLNIEILYDNIILIISLLVGLILFKSILISFLIKIFGYEPGVGIRTGLILAHSGEFSFVILALAQQELLLNEFLTQIVLSVALLSMLVAPFIIQMNGKIARKLSKSYLVNSKKKVNKIEELGKQFKNHVILCGFGRSGQYLARFLQEEKIAYIAIDIDMSRVNDAAIAGESVVYGDATRFEVLRAAGLADARGLIVTYSDDRASEKVLGVIRSHNKKIPIIVRTTDESGIEKLRLSGANEVVPEILEGSLMLASHALVMFDVPLSRVIKRIREFRESKYKIFKGYFKGISDEKEDLMNQHQLHSIEIKNKSFINGMVLSELPLDKFGVSIHHLRRLNMLEDIEPRDDLILVPGDVIVLLGHFDEIRLFENYSAYGK
ncbi:MAG: cation:proton antiporter [Proteobacteria bacterium]|nr:cation:proton antiporter [Pseudomonadota bacterium]MDA1034869.1 cation:proton antiporter [Pseudomonadota bacterium]